MYQSSSNPRLLTIIIERGTTHSLIFDGMTVKTSNVHTALY